MTNQELKAYLHNAIILLEETNFYSYDELLVELGITQEEYNEVMED